MLFVTLTRKYHTDFYCFVLLNFDQTSVCIDVLLIPCLSVRIWFLSRCKKPQSYSQHVSVCVFKQQVGSCLLLVVLVSNNTNNTCQAFQHLHLCYVCNQKHSDDDVRTALVWENVYDTQCKTAILQRRISQKSLWRKLVFCKCKDKNNQNLVLCCAMHKNFIVHVRFALLRRLVWRLVRGGESCGGARTTIDMGFVPFAHNSAFCSLTKTEIVCALRLPPTQVIFEWK